MQVTEAALSPVTGAQAHAVQLHANKFSAASKEILISTVSSVNLLYSYC